MSPAWAVLSIAGSVLVGAMSPGPSFVFVARTAVAQSRRAGVAAALRIGVGGVGFAALAIAGLVVLLAQARWLDAGLKLVGGVYLLVLAWRIWRGADAPLDAPDGVARQGRVGRAFGLGLATQVSNPKAAVVYAAIFAALLPAALPGWALVAIPAAVMLVESGWYLLVALAFSAARPRATHLRVKPVVDRLAGAVVGLLGVRLVVAAGG